MLIRMSEYSAAGALSRKEKVGHRAKEGPLLPLSTEHQQALAVKIFRFTQLVYETVKAARRNSLHSMLSHLELIQ